MKIGIPAEIMNQETRVAVIPSMISALTSGGDEVCVQAGAGRQAFFSDEEYESAGADLVPSADELYGNSDLILKIQPPQENQTLGKHEIDLFKEEAILCGSLPPSVHGDLVKRLVDRRTTVFALEYIPRITMAQSMDVLSSMATVAGYKAVLIAADYLGKFFPLLMTAAGTIPPATVMVLGAGVAGLQAIATAKRLGARVEAFDPRPAVAEQVRSLGAQFLDMSALEEAETAGGYAKEQSEAFLLTEREIIADRLPKVDALISTAQIFGNEAPLLVTDEMVRLMRPGSVIVDLAAAEGGNCECSVVNEVVEKYGVTIYGAENLARTIPVHASQMYSKNITNFVKHVFQKTEGKIDFDEEIAKNSCIVRNGEIVNERVRQSLTEES